MLLEELLIDSETSVPYNLNLKAKNLVNTRENILPAICAISNFDTSFLSFSMTRNNALKLKSIKKTANHTKMN